MAVLTPFFDVVAGVAILAGRSSLLDTGIFKTANNNFTVRQLLALGFIGYGGWNLWKMERAQDKLKKSLGAESFEAEEWWEEYRDELEAVDKSSLDDFELMIWNFGLADDIVKKHGKAKMMQLIINTVEYSTKLSPQLARIAFKQEKDGGEWEEGMTFEEMYNPNFENYSAESFKADMMLPKCCTPTKMKDRGINNPFWRDDGYDDEDVVWLWNKQKPVIEKVMKKYNTDPNICMFPIYEGGWDYKYIFGNYYAINNNNELIEPLSIANDVSDKVLGSVPKKLLNEIGNMADVMRWEGWDDPLEAESFNAEKVKIDWDAVAKDEWDSGYPHNVSLLTYQNKQANKSLLSCLNAHLKIDKEDFDMGIFGYPDLKEHTISRTYDEKYGRWPSVDEINKALPKVIKGLRKQARTGKSPHSGHDWKELSNALKSPISQFTWGEDIYTGRKGWFTRDDNCEEI